MEIDQDEPNRVPFCLEPVEIQEKVAKIQVIVELSSGVQSCGDPGDLGDDPALEGRELQRIKPLRQFR